MRISDAAKSTGLSISAIRYYERRALVRRPQGPGQTRDYSEDDLRTLRFVRNARALGMPLTEIADIMATPGGAGALAASISRHRKRVRAQIDALQEIDGALAHLETCMCQGVSDCTLADSDE